MPPRQHLSTDVTRPSICKQLSTLIAISTANVHRLDAIITQMATVNTLIGLQTGTMAKLIPPPPALPPPNQQPRPPLTSLAPRKKRKGKGIRGRVFVDRIREEIKDEFRAERDEIEGQKQEITKIYNDILKLTEGSNLPN
ncbi:unnamed protein product [Lactuca saligna]|uniref:Uncharacterized protein n=1 Tax=Lactuca saligna TaxID=75948 RepID=A0AA35VMC8_LACSI|nr:unnamed protein product [Lactuca saligna]